MIMTPPPTVRLTVSDLLEKRGMSTADFAERAGLTYNQALALRRNAYTRVDLSTIAKVCEALNVEPGALFILSET
jgi:DNA-binding Xre family transcriptional regulator